MPMNSQYQIIESSFGTGWLITILVIKHYLVGLDPNTQLKDVSDLGEPIADPDSRMSSAWSKPLFWCLNPIDEIPLELFYCFIEPIRRQGRRILPTIHCGSRHSILESLEKVNTS